MRQYTKVYQPEILGNVMSLVCVGPDGCGASVIDQDAHDTWHILIEHIARTLHDHDIPLLADNLFRVDV